MLADTNVEHHSLDASPDPVPWATPTPGTEASHFSADVLWRNR